MRVEEIGGVQIRRERPFLVLEAGVNHEGSLDRAFEMIDAAADAGADMIKFQSYKAKTLASRNSPAYWDREKEETGSQYELFRKYDAFGDAEYRALAARCAERAVQFCSTPFDAHFVDLLAPLMPLYKVASADITNVFLLRRIARKKMPVLLSLGASEVAEIDAAIDVLREGGVPQIGLLHCVLEYPTPPEHANLRSIPFLKRRYPDLTIGWSDHVPPQPGGGAMLLAWLLGADILEKHFTLDKSLPGNDHYHAFDPDDVREFLDHLRVTSSMLGEEGKTVLPWEKEARRQARRSLVAARDLNAGEAVEAAMLTAKRPGTGIPPTELGRVLGRTLARDVAEDELLTWDALAD